MTFVGVMVSAPAQAAYTMIVPQKPGGGTSVWASIVAKHLEKHLGERIVIVHQPGARDIPGFNKFHNSLREDSKTIMVSHGGNAESFLTEEVDYDYREYEPIGGQNLTIVTAKRQDFDPDSDRVVFPTGSGLDPDMMGFTLLICGELPDMEAYLDCFNERTVYVPGMGSGDRRLAFVRGETNTTRESAAAFIKHVQPLVESGKAELWFSHGILDLDTGKIRLDPNYAPEVGNLEVVYKARWGKNPTGPLWDAYVLVKQYRDVLQKALWMDRDSPNAEKVKQALVAMINDPVAKAELEKQAGKYEWMVGNELAQAVDILADMTDASTLRNLVWWKKNAFGTNAMYKPEIVTP